MGVRDALIVGDVLFDAGYAPFVPHLSHYWEVEHNQSRTFEDWMALDLSVVPRCDALVRLNGKSAGVDREVECARAHSVPVFTDLDELFEKVPTERPKYAQGGIVEPERIFVVGDTREAVVPLSTPQAHYKLPEGKRVYLASGFYGDWKPNVIDQLEQAGWRVTDPEADDMQSLPGVYVGRDLEAVAAADVVLAVQGDWPYAYGMMAEMGYAAGVGVRVVYVCLTGRVDSFLAGISRATFTDLNTAVKFINERMKG